MLTLSHVLLLSLCLQRVHAGSRSENVLRNELQEEKSLGDDAVGRL